MRPNDRSGPVEMRVFVVHARPLAVEGRRVQPIRSQPSPFAKANPELMVVSHSQTNAEIF
jgi:hypothetical protein